MSEWSNLPNAAHIDRVLAHAKANPDKWDAARYAAWGPARDAARYAAWGAVHYADRGAAWGPALDEAWGATQVTVWGACLALVAWDEAGELMDKPVATVRFLAQEGVHAAVLLLPAVIVMEESLDTVK